MCRLFYLNQQGTQERENKSRWELIKETLNDEFANYAELKASGLASFWRLFVFIQI